MSTSKSDNEELRRAAANGLVETVEKLLALKAGLFQHLRFFDIWLFILSIELQKITVEDKNNGLFSH